MLNLILSTGFPLATVAPKHWIAFGVFVIVMLVLDLTVFHRKSHEPSLRESFFWTIFWCSLALIFNVIIWFWLGQNAAGAFLLGYVVEWSLSMDNVFVFLVIFSYFGVPLKYQYRVLFWGILGAVVMRLTFVTLAGTLIGHFDWIMWIFGVFLLYTGIKLAMHSESDVDPEKNVFIKFTKRFFPVADGLHGEKFFVVQEGKRKITQLFLVLLAVESTDVLFAIDSVPAIFGIVDGWIKPEDPGFTFIVFTSNVFAILGLRALYFLLAGIMGIFRYLPYGLSGVLAFVGVKMIIDYWIPIISKYEWFPEAIYHGEHDHVVPPVASLIIIFSLLGISIIASIIAEKRNPSLEKNRPRESGPKDSTEDDPTLEDSTSVESETGQDLSNN